MKLQPSNQSALHGARVLQALIGPCRLEKFFREHWRKTLLHVPRGETMPYGDIMRVEDVDTIFAAGTAAVEDWFFFLAEKGVDPRQYVSEHQMVKQVELNKLYALYRDGGTIHVRNTQRLLPSIERLWRSLTHYFRAQVRCNLWVTSDNRQPGSLHYDVHDIFVLQIHGRKDWTLWERNPDLFAPRAADTSITRDQVGEPIRRIVLEPGDMLYMPAGQPHEVLPADPHSVHLAINIHPLLWRDMFEVALKVMDQRGGPMNDVVPPHLLQDVYDQGDGQALFQALGELLQQVITDVERAEVLTRLGSRFIRSVPPPHDGHFVREILGVGGGSDTLTPQTLVRRRDGAPALLVDAGENTRIVFPGGGAMEAPAALGETLRAIATSKGAFTADSLPNNFDLASRELLVRELLGRGLLERAGNE